MAARQSNDSTDAYNDETVNDNRNFLGCTGGRNRTTWVWADPMDRLIKIWCWIVGHDTICLKLHTAQVRIAESKISTTSAHECVRCKQQWKGQWDG